MTDCALVVQEIASRTDSPLPEGRARERQAAEKSLNAPFRHVPPGPCPVANAVASSRKNNSVYLPEVITFLCRSRNDSSQMPTAWRPTYSSTVGRPGRQPLDLPIHATP